jgi:hypothetical protein
MVKIQKITTFVKLTIFLGDISQKRPDDFRLYRDICSTPNFTAQRGQMRDRAR